MNKHIIKEFYLTIEEYINNQGKKVEGLSGTEYNEIYNEETLKILNEGINIFKLAEIYLIRIDKFFGGDDSEESLKTRLFEDLKSKYN